MTWVLWKRWGSRFAWLFMELLLNGGSWPFPNLKAVRIAGRIHARLASANYKLSDDFHGFMNVVSYHSNCDWLSSDVNVKDAKRNLQWWREGHHKLVFSYFKMCQWYAKLPPFVPPLFQRHGRLEQQVWSSEILWTVVNCCVMRIHNYVVWCVPTTLLVTYH